MDDIVAVEDEEAFEAGIELARTDGMIVGPTTGALLHAAREVGAEPGRAVVIAPDDATKYLEAYANYL